jgi:DNA-binding NarL/FixJ family response regulator
VKTIVIAHECDIMRVGLSALFGRQPGHEVVGLAADGERAITEISRLQPTVAVLGLYLNRPSALEIAHQAREGGMGTAILVLACRHDAPLMDEAVSSGVAGYVASDALASELLQAVDVLSRGGQYLAPDQRDAAQPPTAESVLSLREREVLERLAAGRSSKEIASDLRVSVRTVDAHRASIMLKTGIKHLAGLVKYAIRASLTPLDDAENTTARARASLPLLPRAAAEGPPEDGDVLNRAALSFALTPAETLVLSGLEAGRTNAEIAGQLRISTNTVRTHLSRIFTKMEVRTRTQAVLKLMERRTRS